jgi:hypothetical protein
MRSRARARRTFDSRELRSFLDRRRRGAARGKRSTKLERLQSDAALRLGEPRSNSCSAAADEPPAGHWRVVVPDTFSRPELWPSVAPDAGIERAAPLHGLVAARVESTCGPATDARPSSICVAMPLAGSWISCARRLLRTRAAPARRGISSRRSPDADPALATRPSRSRDLEAAGGALSNWSVVVAPRLFLSSTREAMRFAEARTSGCRMRSTGAAFLRSGCLPCRQSLTAEGHHFARGSEPVPGRRAGRSAGRSRRRSRRPDPLDAARRLEPDGRREICGGP